MPSLRILKKKVARRAASKVFCAIASTQSCPDIELTLFSGRRSLTRVLTPAMAAMLVHSLLSPAPQSNPGSESFDLDSARRAPQRKDARRALSLPSSGGGKP